MIRLLNAMVKRAVGKLKTTNIKDDTGKIPKPKKLKKEEQDKLVDSMTHSLAKALPQLLERYQADADKIVELIEIPQFLNLESYTTYRLTHVIFFFFIFKN